MKLASYTGLDYELSPSSSTEIQVIDSIILKI